jgi:DNA polymerase-3 subunit epsilon
MSETTGTNPDCDKIIELGICLFEYGRQTGQIYKVLDSWEWLEDPGFPISPEITKITGITDEMVAGRRIDDRAVNDLLDRVVLVIAHNADFDRRFLERRLPVFATKHWACSRSDIDWKAEGIRSSALEFVAYSLGFFHDGHRAASDCRATLHALAQPLPGTGRLAFQALLEKARLPTWRLWAREAAIEKKDVLKARGYAWSPGEFGRPRCWYRDVSDADKGAEASWLRANVMGPDQAVWGSRITARGRYSDREIVKLKLWILACQLGKGCQRSPSRDPFSLGLQWSFSDATFQSSALVWVGWGSVNPGDSETTSWI